MKRHLSALSVFFHYAKDQGHLSNSARSELTEDHRFKAQRSAKVQRDEWTPEELRALFASPVWTGCASERQRSTQAAAASAAVRSRAADQAAGQVAPIIREMEAEGLSLNAIAAELNRRGVSTPRGGAWTATAVRRVLARLA